MSGKYINANEGSKNTSGNKQPGMYNNDNEKMTSVKTAKGMSGKFINANSGKKR